MLIMEKKAEIRNVFTDYVLGGTLIDSGHFFKRIVINANALVVSICLEDPIGYHGNCNGGVESYYYYEC